jgi:uncharacterized protein (DUF302 family)
MVNDERRDTVAYANTISLEVPYEKAVDLVKEALAAQGFGILTEIDLRATLKEKLDQDIESYVVFGACNPPLAHRALQADREIGLLLPCNVVVREHEGRTLVQALDPQVLVTLSEEEDLQPIADEAARRLQGALSALSSANP